MSSCITPSEAQGSNSAPSAERQVVSEELELAKYNLEVRRIIEKPHYKQIDIDVYSEQNWVGADRPVMNWSESVSVTHGYLHIDGINGTHLSINAILAGVNASKWIPTRDHDTIVAERREMLRKVIERAITKRRGRSLL